MTRSRGITCIAAFAAILATAASPALFAQGRGGPEWATAGGDAQRTGWVRADPKISRDSMSKPGFAVAWKVKLPNQPRQANALTAPVLLDRYIGYRGFRSLAFIAGSSDTVFGIDTDLGRIEWTKHFPASAGAGTAACPGGITASLTESVSAAPPMAIDGRGGRGRGGPARSGVGAPLEGAVTIASSASNAAPPGAPVGGRGPQLPNAPGGGRGRMPAMVYGISGDGAFHSMYVSNGEEPQPPLKFLPANANVKDVSLVDGAAYAITTGNCGGAPDGVWALDIASKEITTWKADAIGIAFGPDGTLYASTTGGDVTALEPKSLNKKASYSGGAPFTTAPVVLDDKGKVMIAAGTQDGGIHLIDAASMKGASSKGVQPIEALATWSDSSGTRWLAGSGAKSVYAWKLNGSLEPAWTHDVASPLAPVIVNGVLFTAGAGNRSAHAILYALDAATGKELWNSGTSITSFIPHNGRLAAGGSQIYFGTYDGTFWEMGFPIEH